ncbi:hypothetical protein EJV47_27095 [Hymenobacter gummosus]|uniref:Uncharacterized protein n=1 Tax=Hymenobacter gummosus TaxID=1776032 RepID=A0A3S0QDV2_9BACT|nr:hypothetical protein [Hymenobacter gummosus]RTQ44875.1 hypothetical protein EJV47_27095 [Hymenobacter gummosus]
MPRRARRPLRFTLSALPLTLLLLLALQRLAGVAFPAPRYVMQLSMPILWAKALASMQEDRARGYPPIVFTLPPDLDQRRRWHRYALIGNAGHDAAMLRAVAERLQRGQRYPAEQSNVRISFGPGTRYGRLVDVLDLMPQLGQKKYALDLYRPEPVLYVFAPRRRGDGW